ncbi:MAG: polyprenyl synthetase family protein [Mycobacterium sp.]
MARPRNPGSDPAAFDRWRTSLCDAVAAALGAFVAKRSIPELASTGVDVAGDVLLEFLDGGKCLRSSFAYLGWLCGPAARNGADEAALRAAASLELLHAFALMQDDVMDCSPLRRGRPAAHVSFARWHSARNLTGSSERFGESAAVILGDLCLVWAEQMLRESGLDDDALTRVWPHYDAMRTELAIGQFADLVNDTGGFPTLEHVLEIARRKSGNYTVRRPLEIGGILSGCGPNVMRRLAEYGDAVGEAFQLRDDILGVFGSPAVTGKPAGADLSVHKATSVVVAAYHLADRATRGELEEYMGTATLDADDIERWRELIAETGAAEWIEELIDERLACAVDWIDTEQLNSVARNALADMAVTCTKRAA